jgi:hypothetical protein
MGLNLNGLEVLVESLGRFKYGWTLLSFKRSNQEFLVSISALASCTSTLEGVDSGGANVIQERTFNAGVCIHRVCIGKFCETRAAKC